MCKNRGVYGFLGTSWVLITTYIISPPVNRAVGWLTINKSPTIAAGWL